MSALDKGAFKQALSNAFERFRLDEAELRNAFAGVAPEGPKAPEKILERPTRRFLVDGLLKALDWDPDDPTQIGEEVRSRVQATGNSLFLDYLGRSDTRDPALLVEAKRADAELPRAKRGPQLGSRDMAFLIRDALVRLKDGKAAGLSGDWDEWLGDLIRYVTNFPSEDQRRLGRVVITAGQWMIVFKSPLTAFAAGGVPDSEDIRCFCSFAEMLGSSDEIFELLSRSALVDTVHLTLTVGEALGVVKPDEIQAVFRGVVVATSFSGPSRGAFPQRTVTPAVVLSTSTRQFAVTRYGRRALLEPEAAKDLADFRTELDAQGDEFMGEVLKAFGVSLQPLPAGRVPISPPPSSAKHAPVWGSTAAQAAGLQQARPNLVRPTGERGKTQEFLVITGDQWFYKGAPTGEDCDLHSLRKAKDLGLARLTRHAGRGYSSFTEPNEPQHCESDLLSGKRALRCQIKAIETHLCCRACVFHPVCWSPSDLPTLPCP